MIKYPIPLHSIVKGGELEYELLELSDVNKGLKRGYVISRTECTFTSIPHDGVSEIIMTPDEHIESLKSKIDKIEKSKIKTPSTTKHV